MAKVAGAGGAGTPKKKSVKTTSPTKGKGGKLASKAKSKAKKSGGKKGKKSGLDSYQIKARNDTLLKWNDIKFFVNANTVLGFKDLTISTSCETEDKENGGEKYVSMKNKKGFEINLTAYFDKRLGIKDVQSDALALAGFACVGKTGYIYDASGSKLVPTNMMATAGKINNVRLSPEGKWICCDVQMTFKSCSKLDGSTESEGSKGYSARVWYKLGSGYIGAVWGYDSQSYANALKKAWAKVPKNAHHASTNKNQL